MRWLVRILVVIVAAATVAVIGVLLLPGERIARIAADQVQARTGRALEIGGDVSVTLWPVLGVTTGPVRLADANWAGDQPMLSARAVSIAVAAPDLLRGRIRVVGITAERPVLRLQRRADGRGNWEFGGGTGAGASVAGAGGTAADPGSGQAAPVTLERLDLTGATISYAENGSPVARLDDADLTLRWPDPDGPAEIEATLRPAGAPVHVAAHLPAPRVMLDGEVAPVALRVETRGGAAAFDGRAAISGAAAGRLTVDSSDSAAVLTGLGLTGGSGLRGAGSVAADLTYTPEGRLSLRDLDLRYGGNRLTGAADVTLGDKPMVTARLVADVLDLRAAAAPSDGSGGRTAPGTPEAGWSRAAIDAGALGLLDADISLTAQGLRLSDLALGAMQARLRLERSRAVLDLARVQIFDGTVTGQLVANNRTGLSVGGKLTATDIALQPALAATAGIDNLTGSASGALEFLGVGQSQDAIMRSLSGRGNLTVGKGFFIGFDLEELIRSGRGNGGSTVFDSLGASFTIENGDLLNRDLALVVKGRQVGGEGRIGLGARDLDYALLPRITHDGRPLRVPVQVTGPWSAPRIRLDLQAALERELGDEIDRKTEELKAKARDELSEKLAKELDIRPDDGQSAEDALKRKLEDEAKKGLLKLLGRD